MEEKGDENTRVSWQLWDHAVLFSLWSAPHCLATTNQILGSELGCSLSASESLAPQCLDFTTCEMHCCRRKERERDRERGREGGCTRVLNSVFLCLVRDEPHPLFSLLSCSDLAEHPVPLFKQLSVILGQRCDHCLLTMVDGQMMDI